MAGARRCSRRRARPARARRWSVSWRTIRGGRTISRNRCVRPSVACGSGCGCGAWRRSCGGSACCVYGLTFTSHFYGARRTVGYVPFNSETLVRGELYEDIRNAVFELAKPDECDAVVVINLCVPTASGVPLRPAAEGDRRRARHRHRRAGLRRADACRGEGRAGRRDAALCRQEAEQGPVQRAARAGRRAADGDADRRDVPGRSGRHRRVAGADGAGGRAAGAVARMARTVWRAGLRGRRGDASVLHRVDPRVRCGGAPGRRVRPGRRRRHRRLAGGDRRRGRCCRRREIDAAKARALPAIRGALAATPIKRRASRVGLRRLGTAGRATADREPARRFRMSAPPARGREWSEPDRSGSRREARTCSTARRSSRTSRRCRRCGRTWRSAPRRWCRRRRSSAIPALYFTNMVSARPLFGRRGRRVARAASSTRADAASARFARMVGFFDRRRRGRDRRLRVDEMPKDPPDSASASARRARRRPRRRGGGELARCWCSTTIVPVAIGARSMRSPRSRDCRSSSTVRSAARICRSRRCCTTPTRCRRTNCRSSSPGLSEEELGKNGTEGAMRRAAATLDPDCRRSSSPARSPR